ncbi:MAG: hypothetical protein EDX89_00880 [Acidobacteria bacterium]|nr:MAG: hypothetical protein EDX89_00880 [Acidobacteriota bacterium]MCE7959460.1 hypothetical protein [Acidobacteria bacterium ACB2]
MTRIPLRSACAALVLLASVPAAAQTVTFGGDRGAGCVAVPAGAQTHVLPVTGSVAAGETAVLNVATTADLPPGTVTDTKGNAWTVDNVRAGAGYRVSTVSTRVTAGLTNADSVTIPYTNGTGSTQTSCAGLVRFTNVVTGAGYLDQVGSAEGTGTVQSVSTNAATSQSNELLVVAFAYTAATGGFSIPGPYSPTSAACSAPFCLSPGYRIVGTAGVQTATGGTNNAVPWGGVLTSYRDVVVPVELQRLSAE